MRNDQMSEAGVLVGVTPEAREMNCTDEEARILLRNRKAGGGEGRGPGLIRSALGVLLLNRSAARFFGTIGYWVFGFLTLQMSQASFYTPAIRTGIGLVDMFVGNPLLMLGLSFMLLVIGVNEDLDEPESRNVLYAPLAALVVIPSIAIAYVLSVICGAIFVVVLPFALSSTAPVTMDMLILLLLPFGYSVPFKLAQSLS